MDAKEVHAGQCPCCGYDKGDDMELQFFLPNGKEIKPTLFWCQTNTSKEAMLVMCRNCATIYNRFWSPVKNN